MAKNRTTTNKLTEKKDKFFKKPRSKFSNPKIHDKNKKESTIPSSDSNNFFIKSNDSGPDTKPETSKRHSQEGNESQVTKKPFDKKKYRLQKYSNKYQLQQWENKRKKAVLHSYYKTLKKDQLNPHKKIYDEHGNDSEEGEEDNKHSERTLDTTESVQSKDTTYNIGKGKRSKPFRKAHEEFQRIREDKAKQKELFLKKKMERKEAAEANKKKRIETYKKLNKKTKKGQPIMKDRIEMLLEKIQNSINQP